jgi:hypothetical protein
MDTSRTGVLGRVHGLDRHDRGGRKGPYDHNKRLVRHAVAGRIGYWLAPTRKMSLHSRPYRRMARRAVAMADLLFLLRFIRPHHVTHHEAIGFAGRTTGLLSDSGVGSHGRCRRILRFVRPRRLVLNRSAARIRSSAATPAAVRCCVYYYNRIATLRLSRVTFAKELSGWCSVRWPNK